jgi:hypothetical protein
MEEKNLKIKNALSFKLLKKTRTTQVFSSLLFFLKSIKRKTNINKK